MDLGCGLLDSSREISTLDANKEAEGRLVSSSSFPSSPSSSSSCELYWYRTLCHQWCYHFYDDEKEPRDLAPVLTFQEFFRTSLPVRFDDAPVRSVLECLGQQWWRRGICWRFLFSSSFRIFLPIQWCPTWRVDPSVVGVEKNECCFFWWWGSTQILSVLHGVLLWAMKSW